MCPAHFLFICYGFKVRTYICVAFVLMVAAPSNQRFLRCLKALPIAKSDHPSIQDHLLRFPHLQFQQQELKKQGYTVEDIPDSVEGGKTAISGGLLTKPRFGNYYLIYNDL